MRQYCFKGNYKEKNRNKLKYKLLAATLLVFIIYGIFLVNMNLAEVARKGSAFSISTTSNPSKLIIDLGEKHIIFNTKIFTDFKEGVNLIFITVKDTVTSLIR